MSDVLIVTGSSRGIGAAIARLAGARGYAVCVNYLNNQAAADAVVADIKESGAEAIAVHADISVEADIVRLFRTVDQELGALSALVNNAGTAAPQARIDEMTGERIAATLRLNVTGTMLCAREAVRRLSTRHGGKGGAILNITSAAARLGGAGIYLDYAASKGAIDTLTRGLALEVAEEGIRVNSVRPGVIDTDIHRLTGPAGRIESLKQQIPVKRLGRAEEVAEAALWLLSEQASYVTGATLDVTGGR